MFGGYLGAITQLGLPRQQNDNGSSLSLLVIGPQGCGKSSFINLAVGQPDCMTSADSKLCTQLCHSCERSRLVDGCEFRFTDTPGFGNEMVEDRKILELLIGHLAPSSDIDRSAADNSDFPITQKIAGILYLYSEDEPFKSRTCRKTIEMLVKVLGKRFLDRVTVLIRSQNKSWIDFSTFMPDEDSPLYPLYCNNTKPRTISYEQDPQSIERILGPYTRLRPRTIQLAALDHFAQQYGDHWRRNDIPRYLREFFPQDIGPPRLVDQLQSVLQVQTSELKGLRTLLAQREEDMRGVQISHDLEFSNIRNERERERIDHQFQLKYLHDTLRSRAREEAAELVSSQKFEIKDLRGLLSQKGEEIQNLRSKHDVELKKIQKDREKEIHDHGLGLKRLYNTIQEQEVEISELKSKTAPGKVSETKGLQGQLGAKDQEITKLKAMNQDINKLKLENDSEIKRLRALLSQKEEDIKGLRSNHETERELFREERANNQVALKVLQHKVEDREAEITQLKSSKDLQAEKLEALGNKIKKLDSEKDSEIERLQQLLVQGEMQDLASGRGIGLKNVQKFAHEIELNCKHLLEAIGEGFSNPESSTDLNLGEVETMAGPGLSLPASEMGSTIRALQDRLQAKDEELMKLKTDSERRSEEAANALQAKEQEITELRAKVNDAAAPMGNNQGGEIHDLNPEIHQTDTESPHHLMQPQERIEPAQITTELGHINRLIEDFGQSLSEHIENYMELNFPNDFQPQNMLSLFGPVAKKHASKINQDAYLLFEYAVQATICGQLYTHLFKPFHPSTADNKKYNTFIMQLYDKVAHQEPQPVAGRWRKDTFTSMSRDPAAGGQDGPDDGKLHQHLTRALSALLGKITAIQPHEVLQEHDKALVKVISKAEELNWFLKGVVSVLGDFQPVAFQFGEAFQPNSMAEVTSKPKKTKHPETILATIQLGLVKSYALGGSKDPEETVLRKAVVFGLFK